MIELALLVWLWGWCSIFAAVVASEKAHTGYGWFMLGLFTGPIALIAAVGLPDRKKPETTHGD